MPETEELIGEFRKEIWRAPDSDFCVCKLRNNNSVVGHSEKGRLVPGLKYRFVGIWKAHPKYGPSFNFNGFVEQTPATRPAIVKYLAKHCKGIGDRIANYLVDEFGREQAIAILKNTPERCAEKVSRLTLDAASAASKILIANEALEQTRLDLMGVLDGYGFPTTTSELLIKNYNAKAAEVIRKDPWILLRSKYPGCGFLKVDKLYIALGHPEDAIERQMFAVWYFCNKTGEGHTWFTIQSLQDFLNSVITGGVRLKEAIQAGRENKKLTLAKVSGEMLIADSGNARDEDLIAEALVG